MPGGGDNPVSTSRFSFHTGDLSSSVWKYSGTVLRLRMLARALCAITWVCTMSASSSTSRPLSIIARKRMRLGFCVANNLIPCVTLPSPGLTDSRADSRVAHDRADTQCPVMLNPVLS